jgi:PAS domain S-box-containing protein
MNNNSFQLPTESFFRFFAVIVFFLLGSEAVVYILLEILPEVQHTTVVVVNAAVLSLILVPSIYFFAFRPITALLKQQRRIQGQMKMFEQTIRSINGVVNIADLNDKIMFVNPAFCKMYGYSEQELIGQHSSIFWSERNPKAVIEQILPATLAGGWKGELYNRRKDGSEFPISLTTSLIKDDAGNHIAVVGMVEDITERRRAELERQTIFEISQGVTTTENLHDLLELIHAALKRLLYAENCFVAIYDRSTELLSFPYFIDKYDPVPAPGPMNRGCTAYVYRTGKPFLLSQERFDQLVEQNEVELVGTNAPSWLGVPLQTPNGTIGVLVLQHYERKDVYSAADVQFLHSVGFHIAMAIERKRAQDELRESEETFRRLFDASADPILILDESGFTNCNPATVSLLGYASKEEFLNKEPGELSPEFQPDGLRSTEKADRMVRTAVKEGYHRFEWVHRKADGSDIEVEVMLTPVRLKGKQFVYTIWRDISDRKKAEAALRESEQHFRAVSQSANEAIITSDDRGVIIGWNNGAEKIFGYTEKEILGKEMLTIIPPEFRDGHREGIRRMRTGGGGNVIGTTAELKGLHKDGRIFPIELSLADWETASGRYYSGIIRDVTKRKQIEAEREQLITELQNAIEQIKTLKGIVPICASCKKIRDDKGYWEQVDAYVTKHTDAKFSHSICPDCTQKLYPDFYNRKIKEK